MAFVLITLRWYHGGEIEFGPPPEYIGGSVTEFFDKDVDMMSYFELRDYSKYLGYSTQYYFFVKWNGYLTEIKCDKVIFDIVNMLKNGDELEVYVSYGVTEPDQALLQLEYFPNRIDNGPSTPKLASIPLDKPPSSNIPSKSFDPTVDEDPSDDDLEDDSDSEGSTSLDSDVDSDVHQEYIDIRDSKRNFNRSQRKSRGTTAEQVNVGEKCPNIGYDELNIGTRDSLVGKLGGDEPYYPSDKAPSFELDNEVGWEDGEDGDRRLIGLDGFSLKGVCKGQMLVAVCRDGNNQIMPIVWAVIEGLEIVVKELLPLVEHRKCARHVFTNWSKLWKGIERRRVFWKIAKSIFQVELKENRESMKMLGRDCLDDLLWYNFETWCTRYFEEHCKCDVVDNNMTESFNAWVLPARFKTIITMLEESRVKMMKRISELRQFSNTWITDISPMALKILQENIDKSMQFNFSWNGERGFEIVDWGCTHTVDIVSRSCSCRAWQLRGIPCPRSVAALHHKEYEPINFVDTCYHKDTYLNTYAHFIQLMNNMKMWTTSNNPTVKPPKIRKLPGRPHKSRRKETDKSRKTEKLSKYGTAGASTGRGRGRAMGSGPNYSPKTSYQQEPGMPSRRVISTGAKVTKKYDVVTSDISYTLRQGFKWKGKSAITNSKLEKMRTEKVIQMRSAAAAKTQGKNISTRKTHVPWK
ncbi:putative enzymatic polyprotein-like [Capsicum annuum]|nr:putative enzymatic polyprotein-like [Capsicum annuum]